MNKKEVSILSGLIFTIIFSLCTGDILGAQKIKDNTLRLHIIANSDSAYDRDIKLSLRDEILQMTDLLPVECADFDTAMKKTKDNLEILQQQINAALKEKGVQYKAKCSVESFYFPTKSYNGFTLPQGEYSALTVRLGKAEGKNWWCVVYPALCSEAFGEITLENADDFIKTEKPAVRFKVVEIYEDIKIVLKGKKAQEYKH